MSAKLKNPHRLQHRALPGSTKSNDAHNFSCDEGLEQSSSSGGTGGGSGELSATVDFDTVGIKTFLDLDPRPTFVVALETDFEAPLEPVFLNLPLRSNVRLMKALFIKSQSNSPQLSPKLSATDFQAWLKTVFHLGHSDSLNPATCSFWGFLWIGFIFHGKWLVISGTNQEVNGTSSSVTPQNKYSTSSTRAPSDAPKSRNSSSTSDSGNKDEARQLDTSAKSMFMSGVSPDWTQPHPEVDLSPHIIFARSIDWACTPLGDMSTWSPEFRQVVCLLMANPHPAALFWGEELTVIYNDAYAKRVAGIKHPTLMGTGFRGPFSEIWESVGAIFNECRRTGHSVAVEDQMLPINRRGFEEETYYTWSLTPLYGGTNTLLGLYNAPFETTRQTINDRRTKTLLKLGESVALSTSVQTFWLQVLNSLEENEFDFPFALLYSVADDLEGDAASMSSESSQSLKSCVLEGSLGTPEGHPAAPTRLDLKRSGSGFIPSFREAMKTREPTLLNISDGTLSESMMEGFEWRGFKEPCRLAVVCPIRPTTGENVTGFLVIGINPRRPYDEDYRAFISILNRQLATSLASVTLFEEEIRRGKDNEIERSRLSEELAIQRTRLQRIAEQSPVGMFSISSSGLILEANNRFFALTGLRRDELFEMSWINVYKESSKSSVLTGWDRLTKDGMEWSGELELEKPWYDPASGEQFENWILADCSPEFDDDGVVKTVMGSITDIALQKRSAKDAEARAKLSEQLLLRTQEAEALQKQRLEEAEETRRQQNNFIDITSHEMRNPLSAIVQCADFISTSMREFQAANPKLDPNLLEIVKANIDSAETIQLCAGHQKNIVNDILTISKLDSNLLLITPVPIRPVNVTEQCLKMFKSELEISDVKLNFHLDPSFYDLEVDSIMLDSSRLLQVLINLMTNAIKFTKSESRRTIDVTLSVFLKPPTEGIPNFRYFPTKNVRSDFIAGKEWGTGEILYLRWEVRDTGCGISEDEKKNLFTRFSQASPRTHVKYGGSGLGLFISRQLTELQGGEIGVASEAGIGSTFAFYVKSRRALPGLDNELDKVLNTGLQPIAQLPNNVSKGSNPHDQSAATRFHHQIPAPTSLSLGIDSHSQSPNLWHILIVEDNIVNQRVLAQQMSRLGCTVNVANHGQEALEKLRETKYYRGREADGKDLSIILMDLEMPVMDGLTCMRKIREMEAQGQLSVRIPTIAVTANARGEQIAAAKDSGMDDVMSKPFRIKHLVSKIETLLRRTQELAR